MVSSPTSSASSSARAVRSFAAVIFDMDGVITDTAAVHSRAWKQMFDEYLKQRAEWGHEEFREFTHEHDYLRYVDGRPRYHGVAAFLESRGINLPQGKSDDRPGTETVCGLGNRKNALFNEIIATDGVAVYPSTLALIRGLLEANIKVGLATSSRNSALILGRTETASLFGTIVDGIVSEQLGLKGKPAPDIFVTAAANLGVAPDQAIVVEDAVTGVRAGAAGGFALVIGVARENNAPELRENGADVVVADLGELNLAAIEEAIAVKHQGASR